MVAMTSAVVFDADGVLVDTEPAWVAARTALFARHGRAFGPGESRDTLGTGVDGTGELLGALLGWPALAGELGDELLALLLEQVAGGRVRALPGAAALVRELRGRLGIAVASNSPRVLLDQTLQAAGLAGGFDVIVAADEVPHAKPAPDLYLSAVERLGARTAESVAVEDSPAGVASARAAGLHVIAIGSAPGLDMAAHEVAASLDDQVVRRRLGLVHRADVLDGATVRPAPG